MGKSEDINFVKIKINMTLELTIVKKGAITTRKLKRNTSDGWQPNTNEI